MWIIGYGNIINNIISQEEGTKGTAIIIITSLALHKSKQVEIKLERLLIMMLQVEIKLERLLIMMLPNTLSSASSAFPSLLRSMTFRNSNFLSSCHCSSSG